MLPLCIWTWTGRGCDVRAANTVCWLELDSMISEDENRSISELDDATEELDHSTELDDATAELNHSAELDEFSIDDEDATAELDDISAIKLEERSIELDELEMDELEKFSEDDERSTISTLKVTYSLSKDSVIFESAISMLSPFQKINLLNSVTFPAPGKGSSAVAYLTFSGTASTISTYM